jgi:hypothetical protein
MVAGSVASGRLQTPEIVVEDHLLGALRGVEQPVGKHVHEAAGSLLERRQQRAGFVTRSQLGGDLDDAAVAAGQDLEESCSTASVNAGIDSSTPHAAAHRTALESTLPDRRTPMRRSRVKQFRTTGPSASRSSPPMFDGERRGPPPDVHGLQ